MKFLKIVRFITLLKLKHGSLLYVNETGFPKIHHKKHSFSTARVEHIVQFYTYEDTLLRSLHKYVYSGLKQDETCLVVATQPHLEGLEDQLMRHGIDTVAARTTGRFISFNAVDMLAAITNNGMPDRSLFFNKIGNVISQAADVGQPIRAFGEMVGLLWKQDNMEGVMRLEGLWNELAKLYQFSLYCAYPEIYFDREIHQSMVDKISDCHTMVAA